MKKLVNRIMLMFGYVPLNRPTLKQLQAEVAAVANGETQKDLVKISKILYKIADPYVLTQYIKKARYKEDGDERKLSILLGKCYNCEAGVDSIKATQAYNKFKETLATLETSGFKLIDEVKHDAEITCHHSMDSSRYVGVYLTIAKA
jgi:hypothetical protein